MSSVTCVYLSGRQHGQAPPSSPGGPRGAGSPRPLSAPPPRAALSRARARARAAYRCISGLTFLTSRHWNRAVTAFRFELV